MKKILIIVLILISSSMLHADDKKSITINHIGETHRFWEVWIINTRIDGFLLVDFEPHYYIQVQKPLFNEIIELIYNNIELFGEREWSTEFNCFVPNEYGTFELFIENDGEERYLNLTTRNSSQIFFGQLYELIRTRKNYNTFISEIEKILTKINIR